MTTDLRDRFDDLLDGVPDHVTADPSTAWSRGARRRTLRRVAVAAGTAAAVAALAGGVMMGARLTGPEPASGGAPVPWWTVDSHPLRVDRPVRESDFHGGLDGVAGVAARSDGWYVVTSGGDLLRLAEGAEDTSRPASISPDGTLVTVTDSRGIRMTDVGDSEDDGLSSPVSLFDTSGREYRVAPDSSPIWSPDSVDVLVPVTPKRGVVALISGHPTGAHAVLAPKGAPGAIPVGWLTRPEADRVEIGWLDWVEGAPRLLATSLEGGAVVRSVPLADAGVGQVGSASLSPRGDGVLAVTTGAGVAVFASDGRRVASTTGPGILTRCPVSWAGSDPSWPVSSRADDAVLTGLSDAATIQADPRLGIGCSVWADQALAGPANRGFSSRVFGHSSSWWAWHWREVSLALLVAAGLLAAWRLRRRPS